MTHATHVIATLVSGMLAKAATQEHSDLGAQARMVAAAFAIADLIEKRRAKELEGEMPPSPRPVRSASEAPARHAVTASE